MAKRPRQARTGDDLFAANEDLARERLAPLAERMRPASLAEFVGQAHLVGDGRLLRDLLEGGKLHSIILWGPPGSGKTTLASLVAHSTQANFVHFSAVLSGVKELREIAEEARQQLRYHSRRTVLFVDEIHRFNKAQQDAFLPHVEDGTVVLIGATTENPSFEVIAPLLSRASVLVLQPLRLELVLEPVPDLLHRVRPVEQGEHEVLLLVEPVVPQADRVLDDVERLPLVPLLEVLEVRPDLQPDQLPPLGRVAQAGGQVGGHLSDE